MPGRLHATNSWRPETGKEIRIFGLQGWTARRYRDAVLDQHEPIWTARSQLVRRNWLPLAAGAVAMAMAMAMAMTVGLLGLLFARSRTDAGEVAQYVVALLAMLAASGTGWEGFVLVHGTVPLAVGRGLRKELEEITEPRDPVRTDRPGGRASGDGKAPPGLRLEDVAFGYPAGGPLVFAGLNLALARTCMRDDPLLVVLDEPTASLDPVSEYEVFRRHVTLARGLGRAHGTVTVVSHRSRPCAWPTRSSCCRKAPSSRRAPTPNSWRAAGRTYARMYQQDSYTSSRA
ncbi:hypothetical protein CLM62_17405 [Streptomyces sp. SA15]|nr:hypothetical protein CLM62_17405 [Streptomyces sp. SA15]